MFLSRRMQKKQDSDFGDDKDIVFNLCVELDKKNYDKAIKSLIQAMDKNFFSSSK